MVTFCMCCLSASCRSIIYQPTLEHRYAEFTEISDWNFTNITFHEAFNMSDGKDLFQMRNVYKNLSPEVREAFASLVSEKWKCIGDTCI